MLLAALAWAYVRFFPLWEAAKVLKQNMEYGDYAYELEVELKPENLTEAQEKLLKHLTWLTGFSREAMCRLTIRGSVWEDKIHARIYPEGAQEPVTELFLEGDNCVISESAMYNTIRENLLDRHRLLRLIMPEQQEELYISLEQIEQLFDLELEAVRTFGALEKRVEIPAWQYFAMLTAMSEEQTENGSAFEMETEQVLLRFELEDRGDVKLQFTVQEPTEVLSEKEELLSRMGIRIPEQLEMVKNLNAVIMPRKGGEIRMPENLVNQGIIDLIVEVRDWIRENFLDDKGTPIL